MPAKLTLTINDAPDGPRQVTVPLGRFTIGRNAENDLVLNVSGLSRRHAVISNFEGDVRISDCESQNGTFVNGQAVTASAALKDGDVISLGSVCEIVAHLEQRDESGGWSPSPLQSSAVRDATVQDSVPAASQLVDETSYTPPAPVHNWISLNLPLLSAAFAAVVVLGAILTIVILLMNRDGNDGTGDITPGHVTPGPSAPPTPGQPCEGLTVKQVERAAQQVMRRVSSDTISYAFPPDRAPLDRLKETVERYCQSVTLAAALKKLQQNRDSITAWSANQLQPDLLAYAALAETEGGATDDPVKAAQRIAPRLIDVWKILNSNHADSTLLFLAAFKIGVVGRGEHPIFIRIKHAGLKTDERNVWALYKKGGLKENEYEFVLKFLAFGIIAQLRPA